MAKELDSRVADLPGVEVVKAKQDLLENADANADQFKQVFGGIGAFSVIAGMLLLVNIFVMLADERKSELGMLRAIGLKRNQLVRAFGMEGAIYALVSAVCGVIAGIGVGRVVVIFAAGLFRRGGGFGRDLDLVFSVKSSSLTTAFMLGATISLVTVWGTSFRLGRLNVIRAIRDIAEAPATGRGAGSLFGVGCLGRTRRSFVAAPRYQPGRVVRRVGGSADRGVLLHPLLRSILGRRFAVLVGCGDGVGVGDRRFLDPARPRSRRPSSVRLSSRA